MGYWCTVREQLLPIDIEIVSFPHGKNCENPYQADIHSDTKRMKKLHLFSGRKKHFLYRTSSATLLTLKERPFF